MSLATACILTLARTIVLDLLACPVIIFIERWLRGLPDARRPYAFAVLLAPFLFPELLVGYTYRDAALASPRLAEWLCAALLFIRIVPIGAIALATSPATLVSDSGIHCQRLLVRAHKSSYREWGHLFRCYWHGPILRVLPALTLMSLVSFQEFELSALLQTVSWTDWFIAAQRVGLGRREMINQSIWPIAMQLPLLVATLCWMAPQNSLNFLSRESDSHAIPRSIRFGVIGYLCIGLSSHCLAPLAFMAQAMPNGLKLLIRQPSQWSGLGFEILIAACVSACAGLSSWFAAGAFLRATTFRPRYFSFWQVLLIPGLAGSLLIGLVTSELFQQAWIRPFYDSPVPWVLSLIVWLLPRAVLLQLWIEAVARTEAIHIAEMLARNQQTSSNRSTAEEQLRSSKTIRREDMAALSANLVFRLRVQPRMLAISLVCYWAYLDLSTAYLLAPSGMASGLVRLYNFMHFGRSAALSAESAFFFGIPLATTLVAIQLMRVNWVFTIVNRQPR